MQPGVTIFQGKIGDQNVVVRYPTMDDVAVLQDFINVASSEHTYIRLQGETFTFAEEAQYVDDVLSQMQANKMVKLLVFNDATLVAVGDVTRQPYASKHQGVFGIIVAKAARGQGIGRKLTELLIAETKSKLTGIEIIVLSVYQQNKIARKLYQNLGFIEYGRLPKGRKRADGYDDQIEMYLPLDLTTS